MPIKPREMEKLILADGWIFKNQVGAISKGKQRRLKCASLFILPDKELFRCAALQLPLLFFLLRLFNFSHMLYKSFEVIITRLCNRIYKMLVLQILINNSFLLIFPTFAFYLLYNLLCPAHSFIFCFFKILHSFANSYKPHVRIVRNLLMVFNKFEQNALLYFRCGGV